MKYVVSPLLNSSVPTLSVATLSCITKQDNDWHGAIPKGSGIWCLVLPAVDRVAILCDKCSQGFFIRR